MDNWTLLFVLLGSIMGLTALVTLIERCRLKGSATITVASILGIFAGVAGASHGPGEILQSNIAPTGIIIEAWPALTLLAGVPAMTLIPSFSVSGIATVILGLAITAWAATCIQSEKGGLVLILLSMMMLFVGGGLLPPVFGAVAGIIGARVRQKDLKNSR